MNDLLELMRFLQAIQAGGVSKLRLTDFPLYPIKSHSYYLNPLFILLAYIDLASPSFKKQLYSYHMHLMTSTNAFSSFNTKLRVSVMENVEFVAAPPWQPFLDVRLARKSS